MNYFFFIMQLYVLYTIGFYLLFFNQIKFFLQFEAIFELEQVKREFNIRNKYFDKLVLLLFLVTLPICYGKDC